MKIDGSGTPRATCLLCPNPSPMTLEGTNTWVLREPGSSSVVVVDPGPDDERHLERVARSVQEQGAHVAVTLLTHRHPDHSAGIRYFTELTGAPVRAVDPDCRISGGGLADGETVDVAGVELRVLATPGHTDDSVCLYLPADDAVLTGDTILGRGTTVIEDERGFAAYMDSLLRLRDLVDSAGIRTFLPGHGPICEEPRTKVAEYISHREERLTQITRAVAAGHRSVAAIVDRVYAAVEPGVRAAAEAAVRAQLRYLAERGDIPAEMHPGEEAQT